MPSKRTPWSGSRRGVDLPADRFGLLDPRVIDAARRGSAGNRTRGADAYGSAVTAGSPGSSPATADVILDEQPRAAGHAVSPGTGEPDPAGYPKRDGGVHPAYLGGHALLGLVLGIAMLLAVGGFCLGRATDPHAAGAPEVTTFVAATPQVVAAESAPAVASPRPEPVRPASPEVGVGFVFGKVRANDGGVLIVNSEITRSEVVVYSNSSTKLYVLIASDPAGIDIGAPVWIYGRKHADGSLTARTIAGISMHGNTS
ncbi:hypothetical protein HGA13_12575 [Nocardia speluncae]|uniref:DUF5666 domain-containing protein n=1 Tax=Nocardia speluncae TaxID=419477 RepID=A0A846XEV0_9NOCA|nr:hypothetical protein [Nocardia speluncae]NKY33905.1 hypothetical protein [Nocardia speluncae]